MYISTYVSTFLRTRLHFLLKLDDHCQEMIGRVKSSKTRQHLLDILSPVQVDSYQLVDQLTDPAQDLVEAAARAEAEPVVAEGELAVFKEADGDGFFCMDKVMTVQEIVYDEEVKWQ